MAYQQSYAQMMNVENIALIVESLAGADPLAASRTRPVVEARCILVAALRSQGWTETAAGEAIGFNHSTIHHYGEMLSDARLYNPALWAKWMKLKKILEI